MKISTKMIVAGIALLLAMVITGGIILVTNQTTIRAAAEADMRDSHLKLCRSIRDAMFELKLAAMDSIIDRADGTVSAERMEIINQSISYLKENTDALVAVADTDQEKADVQILKDSIGILSGHIQNDLVALIQKSGSMSDEREKAFAKIDDDIDGSGKLVGATIDRIVGSITAEQKEASQELTDSVNRGALISVITIAVAAVVMLVYLFFIGRGIITQINTIVKCSRTLSSGDLSVQLPVGKTVKTEFEVMGDALNTLVDSLRKKAEIADAIADGDLTRTVDVSSDKDVLGKSLNKMLGSLSTITQQINDASSQVNSGSDQISGASQSLSQGATESAASLEEINSSMAEIGSQTKHNAENAQAANSLATSARGAAEEGSNQMTAMVSAMTEIESASTEITKIIKAIDDIAFQTNLLALNAAVEAARAGRHGKGFAVVAEEVRNLAGRSAKAAQETAGLIEASNSKIKNGASIAHRTSEALGGIVGQINKAADLVSDIAIASNEQSIGVQQVTQGLNQIEAVTQQNTAQAEETASAAQELSEQATRLQQLLSTYKLKNDGSALAISKATPSTTRSWGESALATQYAGDDEPVIDLGDGGGW